MHNIFEAVDDIDQTPDESTVASKPNDADMSHDYMFGASTEPGQVNPLLTWPGQLAFLWQSFVTNVDPFIKVLHIPSVNRMVQTSINLSSMMAEEDQALLLAVSLAAIVSLDDDAVGSTYGLPKQQVAAQYRKSLERAFSKSQLVTSRSMTLLQAFVIYLSVLPYMGSADEVWPLIGLLLRLATRLGLHRDASHDSKLSVLEGEMRRRLWWQICLIDSRSRNSSVPQVSVSEAMFDTTKPANIDDEKLQSLASNFDIGSEKITGTTLFLIRCELWQLSRSMEQSRDQTLQTHLNMVRKARRLIEATYLGDSDLSKPLDSFVHALTSLFFAKIESVLFSRVARQASKSGPNNSSNLNDAHRHASDQLLRSSSEIVSTVANLITNPSWRQWQWQLQGRRPWLAMEIVLEHMVSGGWNSRKEDLWNPLIQLNEGFSYDGESAGLQSRADELFKQAQRQRQEWQSPSSSYGQIESQQETGSLNGASLQSRTSYGEPHAWPVDSFSDISMPLSGMQMPVSENLFDLMWEQSIW